MKEELKMHISPVKRVFELKGIELTNDQVEKVIETADSLSEVAGGSFSEAVDHILKVF